MSQEKIVLGRILNRRKELLEIIGQKAANIQPALLMEVKTKRISPRDGLEALINEVENSTLSKVCAEVNFYVAQLHLIDEAIQRTNWTEQVTVEEGNFAEFPTNNIKPMQVPVAKALIRRKELKLQHNLYAKILGFPVYVVESNRRAINLPGATAAEALEDATVKVPKLIKDEVQDEVNWITRQIRVLDTAINQSNWTAQVDIDPQVLTDYKRPVQVAATAQ